MRNLLLRSIAGTGLLLFGLTATAQYPPRRVYTYQDQDDTNYRGRMLDRMRGDLNRVQADTFPFSADRYRLNRAREEVSEFQSQWAAGNFNVRELDEAIGALQRVVDMNNLSYRDRDLLVADLNRLRDIRESVEGYER